MKHLFVLIFLLKISTIVYAQIDTVGPPKAIVRSEADIYNKYSYHTKFITADLTLYKDSTYSYSSYGCSWWHTETGKWKMKNNAVIVLKMKEFKDKNRTRSKIFLRRHKLAFTEDAVTAKAIKLEKKANR